MSGYIQHFADSGRAGSPHRRNHQYSGLQLGWIHRGVGAGFEDNLWFKKQRSSLNPPLRNLYSTKSLSRYNKVGTPLPTLQKTCSPLSARVGSPLPTLQKTCSPLLLGEGLGEGLNR